MKQITAYPRNSMNLHDYPAPAATIGYQRINPSKQHDNSRCRSYGPVNHTDAIDQMCHITNGVYTERNDPTSLDGIGLLMRYPCTMSQSYRDSSRS